ncbi:hypothetical protein RD792_017952 [Penstemon davidsonii]|uniref:Protein kinase domain-containing protein n=1 Tax=Penstemon davidsonii TaxID=160366 RepID=A0ABR0DVD7_9LAMI|nr:hypothetical protein RD792_017952 [Penstemon davidsonii]
MKGEPELPTPPAKSKFLKPNLSRPISINPDSTNLSRTFNTTCTSTTSSSSSSTPELVRHVQAAFKRNRALGTMQSNVLKPRRCVFPRRETSKDSNLKPHSVVDVEKSKEDIPQDQRLRGSSSQSKNVVSLTVQNQEDASITPPSEWGSTVNTHEESILYKAQRDQPGLSTRCGSNNAVASSCYEPENVPAEVQKKVYFASECNVTSRGADDRMATGMDDLLSHMGSLALTEMECDEGNQVDNSAAVNQDWQHHDYQSMEMENSLRSEGRISSLLPRKTLGNQDFGNFLQNDLSNAVTQSSVAGSYCATSTLINPTYAPRVSSTTCCSKHEPGVANMGTEPARETEVQLDVVQPSYSLSKYVGGPLSTSQAISSVASMPEEGNKTSGISKEPQSSVSNDSPREDNNLAKGNAADVKSEPPSSEMPASDAKLENSKSEKLERGASGKATSTSRKRGSDPDMFFKVNGKLYQRLGKIGSGGSSEVHKVISSDCKIYALKKIKLKGRDYATAFGFCQEIEYLNKLKGKNNIIQLIDYEVTEKTLLQEVMNGSMSDKNGRIKDDEYIYMVLEHGEIDLAHMLSQKWKELDGSSATIDENWLRFYWQQILLAVNTIHEERIVHSDLKPANFLLVRGSLKLIDFGIAKAIMSDTTNIQRDSQVGTLSYMSPEAFMCNEVDENGNTIKCGRPSDIWSLGCILYQMVYGRTPFAEYKTFWAKFKVITDPNHEIIYEPVSNPWLLDLMKKCLAWDKNKRWRIPQLLQHPFIVPPIPPQLFSPVEQSCTLFQQIAELSANDEKALMICSQLQDMVKDPRSLVKPDSSISREHARKLLYRISTLCFQLQDQLANTKETNM